MATEEQRLQTGPPGAPYGSYEPDTTIRPTNRCCGGCPKKCMSLLNFSYGLTLFPIALIILFPVTFFTSYLIAVLEGHVEPGFPYISDTGTQSPESCIFGQLLNICSLLALINIYLKYRHVVEQYQFGDNVIPRVNVACLIFGILSSLGASIVANFQETNVLVVHIIGAMLAFGVGTLYCWLMTWVTYRQNSYVQGSRALVGVRLAIAILATISFITSFLFAAIASKKFHGKDMRKWYPGDGGFTYHVLSTASEWILAFCILAYFATFIYDFRKLGAHPIQIFVIEDEEVDLITRGQEDDRLGNDDMVA